MFINSLLKKKKKKSQQKPQCQPVGKRSHQRQQKATQLIIIIKTVVFCCSSSLCAHVQQFFSAQCVRLNFKGEEHGRCARGIKREPASSTCFLSTPSPHRETQQETNTYFNNANPQRTSTPQYAKNTGKRTVLFIAHFGLSTRLSGAASGVSVCVFVLDAWSAFLPWRHLRRADTPQAQLHVSRSFYSCSRAANT